jgi:hypothetical protein
VRGYAVPVDIPAEEHVEVEDSIRQYVRSRVWVSDEQRKRCTYVARDALPADAIIRRF